MTSEKREYVACPHCGSSRVRPRRVLAAPIIVANRSANMFICDECGQQGVLVIFESEEAREEFRAQKLSEKNVKESAAPKSESVPIIPLHSKPLLGSALLESIPFRSADVVSVCWTGEKIEKTEYEVSFEKYWDVIGGTRYRAGTIYVLDIGGINKAEPSFQAMRELSKCDCKILFDLGVSGPEDLMDGFMVDVDKVVASTKSIKGLQDLKDIYSLTEDCIPCIDLDNGIIWAGGRKNEPLEALARSIEEIGYQSLVVMDLSRLGTWSGPSMDLISTCSGFDANVYLGGGIKEEDAVLLLEKGIANALIDPYTPMMRDLMIPRTTGPKPTAADSPKPSTTKDVRPSPV